MNKNFSKKNSIYKDQRGLISIIALGIFAVLSIVGIMVQMTVVDTINAVKNTNNYNRAKDTGDSVGEYVLMDLSRREAGFNKSFSCFYGEFKTAAINASECANFAPLANENESDERNIQIDVDVKGRSEKDVDYLRVDAISCPGVYTALNSCYTVPTPGTGDAGDRCDLYDPLDDSPTVSQLITGGPEVAQSEYSCNWNKLAFGSSSTDRVTIPLFYELEDGTIVNPFNTEENGGVVAKANQFAFRIRMPCLPCVYSEAEHQDGINQVCSAGQDKTVCDDNSTDQVRYALSDENPNDIVAQWQITGLCEIGGVKQECGLLPHPGGSGGEQSTITVEEFLTDVVDYIVLSPLNPDGGISTNSYKYLPLIGSFGAPDYLPTVKEANLSFFLSDALTSDKGQYIPYLEYQFLSNFPVSNDKTQVHLRVNVNVNIYEKNFSQKNQKSLLDFTVQN